MLAQALKRHLGHDCLFEPAAGGFFIWLTLPAGTDATQFQQIAQNHHVNFQPGREFSSQGGQNNRLRLSFAYYDQDTLRQGVQRLKTAYDAYTQNQQ